MAFTAIFRMKALPRDEYRLMKGMIDHFNLTDPQELFTVLLRLGYEVMAMHEGAGEKWIREVIGVYRDNKGEVRVYEVGGKSV